MQKACRKTAANDAATCLKYILASDNASGFTQGRREQRQYSAMAVAEEQSMIVCDTNDQSTQEGGGRGNGKAMHAGPIRHSHKINQFVRSFVLINETPGASRAVRLSLRRGMVARFTRGRVKNRVCTISPRSLDFVRRDKSANDDQELTVSSFGKRPRAVSENRTRQ